jgi:hypothetical protein
VSTSYIESVLSLGCIDTGIFAIALPLWPISLCDFPRDSLMPVVTLSVTFNKQRWLSCPAFSKWTVKSWKCHMVEI